MIVLDDLGFADFGCFGSAIDTPNIDRLAEHGSRYNNFHVTAICSASRACLLTGRNHHAVRMGFLANFPLVAPGYTGRIPRSVGTLPRLMRNAGYNTFAAGKWHLAPHVEQTAAGPFDRWPLGMGFDRYYGFIGGMTKQWMPDLVSDNGFVEPPRSPDEGYHLTEDIADQAIRFVQDQQQAAPDKPFFLYFATGATHSPHHVPAEWAQSYRGHFDDGWEAHREQTFTRQQKLGVVPPGTTLPERPSWIPAWDELSADERRVCARQMETYAGFLSHTDAQIGRLMDHLERLGILADTLIMVLSDNGAAAEQPQRRLSFEATDLDSMTSRIGEFGDVRAFNSYAWGWTWGSNTPFKLWKTYTWLGGVRVPLVVRWPASDLNSGNGSDSGNDNDNDNGEVRSQFCHAIDLMPTILQAAGIESPEALDGVSQQPIDGRSILETRGDDEPAEPTRPATARTTQYFEMLGSRAIYHDGWMAVTDHVADNTTARELIDGSHDFDQDRWSLCDLSEDFSQAHDLAETHPRRLRQMVELWWHEAGRNQVLPLMDVFWEGRAEMADVVNGRLCVIVNLDDNPQRAVATAPVPSGRHEIGIAYPPRKWQEPER